MRGEQGQLWEGKRIRRASGNRRVEAAGVEGGGGSKALIRGKIKGGSPRAQEVDPTADTKRWFGRAKSNCHVEGGGKITQRGKKGSLP